MLCEPIFLAGPSFRDVKVRNMPVFDHQSESTGSLKSFKLTQTFDRENVCLVKLLFLSSEFFVLLRKFLFIRYGVSLSTRKIEKSKGRAITAAFVSQYLTLNKRPVVLSRINFQDVSDQSLATSYIQAKLKGEFDWLVSITTTCYLSIASSFCEGLTHIHCQSVF